MPNPPQHILITGANRGIGLEMTRQFVERGDFVFAACRKPAHAQELRALTLTHPERIDIIPLEVTDRSGIAQAAARVRLKSGNLDVLINNAGIFERGETPDNLTAEGMLHVFHVNCVAPVMLTQALLPMLKQGHRPRILNISSQLGSLARKRSGGDYSYCSSKAALNMLTRTLAADLRRDGIVIVTVHPGWVQTDMGGRGAAITPQESAQGLLTLADSGEFFTWQGDKHPW
ncbi:MAG: SDR family oxidoreductase [Caldilineales bacterium]|nr:SDR family oxidoreductase [Caldilineales bacterium]